MNILKQLKDYLPLLLALIAFIFFLASLKYDTMYTKQKVDEIAKVVEKFADHERRITILENILGIR